MFKGQVVAMGLAAVARGFADHREELLEVDLSLLSATPDPAGSSEIPDDLPEALQHLARLVKRNSLETEQVSIYLSREVAESLVGGLQKWLKETEGKSTFDPAAECPCPHHKEQRGEKEDDELFSGEGTLENIH